MCSAWWWGSSSSSSLRRWSNGEMMKRALSALALLIALPAAADEVKRPSLSLEPAMINFTAAGSDSFKIVNRGNAPLEIRRVAALDRAFLASDPGARTLQPGESMDIKVTYTPDSKRPQSFGSVQVFSNDDQYPPDE